MNITVNNRGQLAYRTCFSSITRHGYKLDLMKSGMQKYLRRGELKMMMWCAVEIFNFELMAEDEKEKKMCKGIITNMLNRIIVMMDEELLFCEVERYLVLRNLIEKFDEDRKNGMKYLINICKCLSDGKICRHASDIRAFWDYRIRFKDVEFDEEKKDLNNVYCFEKFVEKFNDNDDNMFYYMFKIFNSGEKISKGGFRKKKEYVYKIWEVLFDLEFVKNNKYNNGLVKRLMEYKFNEFDKNKKRGERFMFLVNSIELVRGGPDRLFINEVYYNDLMEMYNVNNIKDEEIAEILKCNSEYKQMDDYVIDMHTSMGRKMGKNRKDFALEGCVVLNEDRTFLKKEWREYYIKEKLDNPIRTKKKRWEGKKKVEKSLKIEIKKEKVVKKVKKLKQVKLNFPKEEKKTKKTDREIERQKKYKMIKKMRGKPNFDDLERDLKFVDSKGIDKIRLCTENTCGNKVMCFEYNGKIWKEGRKSMNYNRDYCVLDECKELFGLEKIGMERILSNFRIEKVDKNKKSWVDNWQKVMIKDGDEKVVYCVMDKIEPGIEIGKKKKEMLENRKMLKEFVKIGVFRGIFRVSDFNGRNVLIKGDDKLVSIDEGDIGKRLDIIGGREKWLINELNKDKMIIKEILSELISIELPLVESIPIIAEKMKKYKFSDELVGEVGRNFRFLKKDLEKEGIEFE